MRTAELINLAFFIFLTVLALVFPLTQSKRRWATAIGSAGICLTAAANYTGRVLNPLAASVFRDWLPSVLLLMVYWQAGQFFVKPREGLQYWLLRSDEKAISPFVKWLACKSGRAWIVYYGEIAYFFCYIMVPLGLGAVYLLHKRIYADKFWTIVLPSAYFCYIMIPFLQTLPPRVLQPLGDNIHQRNRFRRLNLWILRKGSIHANTFPSAHVAASVATALALFSVEPVLASIFLWAAISVAFGAVLGRYHFLADVVLGAALAFVVFAFEKIFIL